MISSKTVAIKDLVTAKQRMASFGFLKLKGLSLFLYCLAQKPAWV